MLQELAEAYYGLLPWNAFGEGYYDEMLMRGFERPKTALVLGPSERLAYCEKHGITP